VSYVAALPYVDRSGHGFCLGGENPPWRDEVLAFLAETMHR
jgi:hypothetical protein